MNILFYSSSKMEAGERLERVIKMMVSKVEIRTCRTIRNFEQRLRQPLSRSTIVVIFVSGTEDLLDVLSLKDLLEDRRIILVLPDSHHDTVAKGHILRPRFVCYHDSDLMEVAAVLTRMIERKNATYYLNEAVSPKNRTL
jgi:hypothetical protein